MPAWAYSLSLLPAVGSCRRRFCSVTYSRSENSQAIFIERTSVPANGDVTGLSRCEAVSGGPVVNTAASAADGIAIGWREGVGAIAVGC